MSEEKEKALLQSFRLPVTQVEFIDQLKAIGILGSTKSAVARALLDRGIKDIIDNEFVKKYLDTLELLRKK
jgi:hypothetical protein